MPAGAAVDEAHVGIHRHTGQIEPQGQLAARHLVLEQRNGAVWAGRAGHHRSRVGSEKQLRHHPQHAHLGAPHQLGRQGAVDHAAGVGGQIGPLEPRQQLGHDPVVGHDPAIRQFRGHGNQLVELNHGGGIEHDVEGARVAVHRLAGAVGGAPVHQPDTRQIITHTGASP